MTRLEASRAQMSNEFKVPAPIEPDQVSVALAAATSDLQVLARI